MKRKITKSGCFFAVATVFILISATFTSFAAADASDNMGFDKGPSAMPVVPLKKTTFVNYDKESLIDDYAYLASVPTAVFSNQDKLYSHPLLFYQDEYKYEEDKERSLNPRQGLDYFMEDWMSYCDGECDQITLINVPENKLDSSWKAKEYKNIQSDDIYNIAKEIALQDWSYSNSAVISVIDEEYENPEKITEGTIHGTLDSYEIGKKQLTVTLPDIGASSGVPKFFEVKDKRYKYLTAVLSWPFPTLDYDLQLTDLQLGMLDIAMGDYASHNNHGAQEITGAYIHNYGEWKASVTAVPKKQLPDYNGLQNQDESSSDLTIEDKIKLMAMAAKNEGTIDLTFYPGTDLELPQTPFGCRDIDITLKWENPNVRLGFTVIGPAGSEIVSSISKESIMKNEVEAGKDEETRHISLLGETEENENYQICIFSLDDVSRPLDFEIEYSWNQNFTKKEGDCLASATNGAVLASKLNAPLLYTSSKEFPSSTKDTLYKLGVKKIYLVNIGNHLDQDVKQKIYGMSDNTKEYTVLRDIYSDIKRDIVEQEVVFTTIDPWTYWYVKELKPAGENHGERFIGPASYIAAHHICPVVIVENHPELSQSITYHTDFWGSPYYTQHVSEPNSGNMMYSSELVYEFLEEYELGRLERKSPEQQIREKIIIVAGQYDIGMSFDRSLTGAAIQGRFMFSPVDTAYTIARNVFYPALIFVNPALQGENDYITGSESEVQGLGSWKVNRDKMSLKGILQSILEIGARFKKPKGVNIVQTKPSQEEKFENPVLMTFNTYLYRFNQKASKHWGTYYERADGIIPGITHSPDAIDDGAVPGRSGQFYPDISESEVVPFYAEKGGYNSVFSTAFEPVTENLNRGVLIWVENCHGWHPDGGLITMWDPSSPYAYEENPWRSYEPIALYPGNIRDFIHLAASQLGVELPTLTDFHLLTQVGSTQNPDVAHINTQLRTINKILTKYNSPMDMWGAFGRMIYRDRVLHPLETIQEGLPFVNWFDGDGKITISKSSGAMVENAYNGYEFDDALENLHSCGLNTISCLPAGTYLHLTWTRHGMGWVIIDPWTTTDWAGAWAQMLLKWFAKGDTVGEAYERSMRASGPEYSVGHYWWDIWENVCYFGDPELRPYVPSTKYSDENHWTIEETKPLRYNKETNIAGHMPFGAAVYPNEREPEPFVPMWILALIVLLIIIIAVAAVISRKRSK